MKSHEKFPNPEIYAAQQEIRQRYNDVLSSLMKVVKGAEVRDTLNKFRNILTLPETDPFGKLPVYNVTYGLSPEKNKHRCLLNFISWMVQRNWVFDTDEDGDLDTAKLVKSDLTILESIAEKGLNAFEIKGTKFPGYYLKGI